MRGALSSRIAGAVAVAALCALGSSCGAEPASGPNPPAPLPTTDTSVSTAPTSTTTVAPVSEPVPVEVAPPPPPTKTPTQQPVPPAAKPKPNPAPAPAPVADPPKSAYYKNCDAARAAGAAPLHRGEPGYRSALDRDNDGIACE